jgi:hypothetical protein
MEQNKTIVVELRENFSSVMDTLTKFFESKQAENKDKFDQITTLRDEIKANTMEMNEVKQEISNFARAIGCSEFTEHLEEQENAIDLLDELDECFTKEIGVCAECGMVLTNHDDIITDDKGNIFCCEDCKYDYHIVGYCDSCGMAILDTDDYIDDFDGLFCSEECQDDYHYVGVCAKCGESIYDYDEYEETDDGEYICGNCVDEIEENEETEKTEETEEE